MLLSYRSLKSYKYQLVRNFEIDIFHELGIVLSCDDVEIKSSEKLLVELKKYGKLKVHRDYAWNNRFFLFGDYNNYMRANLVKDVLNQMIKNKQLAKNKTYIIDNIVYELRVVDGMPRFLAFLLWLNTKLFRSFKLSLNIRKDADSIHVVPYM